MRKILPVLALALALAFGASQAQAQARERQISENPAMYMLQVGLPTQDGVTAIGWFKFYYKNISRDTVQLVQVNCQNRLFRYIRTAEYRYSQLVSDTGENWQARWENPLPNSFSELFDTICWSR